MILVTGASGTNGSELIKLLSERGVSVLGMVRRTRTERDNAMSNVEYVTADFDDPASLRRALEGVERVFLVTNSTGFHSASAFPTATRSPFKRVHPEDLRAAVNISMGWILNGLSFGESSRTILFAALRCQFLQYAVNPQNNLFEFFQFARLFVTRQDRNCNFAA